MSSGTLNPAIPIPYFTFWWADLAEFGGIGLWPAWLTIVIHSVLLYCSLVYLTRKVIPKMTYNVSKRDVKLYYTYTKEIVSHNNNYITPWEPD